MRKLKALCLLVPLAVCLATDSPAAAGATSCPAPGELDPAIAPTREQLDADLQRMVSVGPRHTGHPGDRQWIDVLEAEMRRIGLEGVTRTSTPVLGPNPLTSPGVQTTGLTADHLHGVLPGQSDETILLVVHSDGQNAIEENGTIALLRTVEYLSRLPKECRRHSFALAMTTCHMALCPSWEAPGWMLRNPEIVGRTVALVSAEHIGQRARDAAGTPGPLVPWHLWTRSPGLRTRAQQMVGEMGIPAVEVQSFSIGTAFSSWFATGFTKPVVGGMASPLESFANGLTDPAVGLEHVDRAAFHQITLLMTRMTSYLDSLTTQEMHR